MSRSLASALLFLALALVAGCTTRPTISTSPGNANAKNAEADELALALDSLRKLAEGAEAQPAKRTVYYLNEWLRSETKSKADWQPDRLLDVLPRALRSTPGLEDLDRLKFEEFDVPYLQQTLWLHDIAQRARREPPPAHLAPWLKEIEQNVGVPESEQLAAAERLFDWTIRNIQLDPLPPEPKGPVATAGTGSELPPAAQGEVGPGYGHMPLQILLYGHGDAYERGRIFIQLCRQAGIDAVMIGIREQDSPTPRPWIPAAFIGQQLYLFDTRLGLPVPGPDGRGIATLAQLNDDVSFLERLTVEGEDSYPVVADDLQATVALIDAEPSALSRRMQLLTAALPNNRKLALSVQPSQLDAKLRKSKAVGQVSLWRAPFEAILYQIGRFQRMQTDPQAAEAFQKQEMVFAQGQPLVQGRNLHLQGQFEPGEQEPGARGLYLQSRAPDREIDAIAKSAYVRERLGLEQQLPEDAAQKAKAIQGLTEVAVTRKQNATYWIGLTYYEAGNYPAAIEWLAERTVETIPPSPWTPGARYNLARCYEQLGETDVARRWLESDSDSPQRAGNLLRARMLAERNEESGVGSRGSGGVGSNQ